MVCQAGLWTFIYFKEHEVQKNHIHAHTYMYCTHYTHHTHTMKCTHEVTHALYMYGKQHIVLTKFDLQLSDGRKLNY